MIVALVSVALLLAWIRHRAVRRRTLSGLDSARPVFSVEPPTRRLGSRRTEAL